jgi:hypothetical protein
MHENESVTARYRRLARECLEVAHSFPAGERRTALLQMAQVWQRLADDYPESSAPLSHALSQSGQSFNSNSRFNPRTKIRKSSSQMCLLHCGIAALWSAPLIVDSFRRRF